MAQKASGSVPPHKHCPVCGISIAPSKDYCSDQCREIDETNIKKVSNYRKLTMGMMLAAIGALILLTVFLRVH